MKIVVALPPPSAAAAAVHNKDAIQLFHHRFHFLGDLLTTVSFVVPFNGAGHRWNESLGSGLSLLKVAAPSILSRSVVLFSLPARRRQMGPVTFGRAGLFWARMSARPGRAFISGPLMADGRAGAVTRQSALRAAFVA